jgi:predicted O-methyltransferase YrrM
MQKFSTTLYGAHDPYADFEAGKFPTDMQGWNSHHPFFEKIITGLRPNRIIEVGTWKGGSAINMAKICASLGLETEIICIDTWLGASEHVLFQEFRQSLNYKNGFPQLYYTFMANVISEGLQNTITPFPMASLNAAVILKTLAVTADLIYIDAAHEYELAYADADAYWPLVTDRGIMLFDDYGYSGVTKAVCRFAYEQDRAIYASYEKAFIPKGYVRPDMTLNNL